jgi:NhaP-type Na+/H+ or K+/H+ antiporter
VTRFLTATALTITAWMAAFVTAGTGHPVTAAVAVIAAGIAHAWAVTAGRTFEHTNPTKETQP